MKLIGLLRSFIAAATVVTAVSAVAQAQDYPNRSIEIVCPSAAGGGSDTLARLIARELEPVAGQSVVVLNKPGAAALIGTRAVVGAKPDGYTLLLHASTAIIGNASIVKSANYDPEKDLVPISPISGVAWAVVVGKDSPIKSVAELTAMIKKKEGKSTYASPNNATIAATELYLQKIQSSARRVNYKEVTAAIGDVATGEVDFTFADIPLALAQARADRVRILAVTTPKRVKIDGSYPTMIEAGVPGYEYVAFFGMWAPAKTPQPVVDKLSKWMTELTSRPEVQEAIFKTGFEPLSGTREDLARMVATDAKIWNDLVKRGMVETR